MKKMCSDGEKKSVDIVENGEEKGRRVEKTGLSFWKMSKKWGFYGHFAEVQRFGG